MKFWRYLDDSVYNPDFYNRLRQYPLSFSLKYFFGVVIILAFVLSVLFSFELVPATRELLSGLGPGVLERVPDNFILLIRDGIAQANVKQPFYFSIPVSFFTLGSDLEHVLVIDTDSPVSVRRFHDYHTFALLSKDSILAGNSNDVRLYPLDAFDQTTVTKDTLAALFAKIESTAAWIVPVFLLAGLVGFVGYFSLKLGYLLLVAFLVMLVGRARRVRLTYKQAYQASLHAATLGMAVEALSFIFYPRGITFLFTLTLLAVAWVNLVPRRQQYAVS